jgi:hypothetical protein
MITASRMTDVLANGHGTDSWGETAKKYAMELALIRLGVPIQRFQGNKATEWGLEKEAEAFPALAQLGLHAHEHQQFNTRGVIGCTPDGYVDDLTGVEIKCPFNPLFHAKDLTDDSRLRSSYYAQVQAQMYVMGWLSCWIVSFDPTFPSLQTQVARYQWSRHDDYITAMVTRAEAFEKLIAHYVATFGK